MYAGGEQILGELGYQDVTIAGIAVKKQEIVLIDEVAYRGDGVTSGILGLAYPIVVRAFNSTNPAAWIPGTAAHLKYDPIFTNMYKQGHVSPGVFSVAMDRKNASGYLAFGGLPPVAVSPDFAKTPIRIVSSRLPGLPSALDVIQHRQPRWSGSLTRNPGGSRRGARSQARTVLLHHSARRLRPGYP